MASSTARTDHSVARPLRRLLGVPAAAGAGAVLAGQSRLNSELSSRLHDSVAAALASFGGGLLVLVVVCLLLPAGRTALPSLVAAVRGGRLRLWQCLGGLSGGFLVLAQGQAVASIGVALFTVAVVAGQVANGLVMDRVGVGPGGPQAITVTRALGSAGAVAAVLLSVSGQFGHSGTLWLVLLPLVAGIGMAWQAGVNGRVRVAADSPLAATTLNFLVGTLGLLLAFAVRTAVHGLPVSAPSNPLLYLGGPLGILVIGSAVVLVRWVGVLLLSIGMIAGQLLGALLLNLLLPGGAGTPGVTTVLGIVLTLVAAAVAALPGTRSERGGQGSVEA